MSLENALVLAMLMLVSQVPLLVSAWIIWIKNKAAAVLVASKVEDVKRVLIRTDAMTGQKLDNIGDVNSQIHTLVNSQKALLEKQLADAMKEISSLRAILEKGKP